LKVNKFKNWSIDEIADTQNIYHDSADFPQSRAKSDDIPAAINLTGPQVTRKAYARRMWIEEAFGNEKGIGFDLENTHLRHFLRLSRRDLVIVLLYV
jgi:hypothetical protein